MFIWTNHSVFQWPCTDPDHTRFIRREKSRQYIFHLFAINEFHHSVFHEYLSIIFLLIIITFLYITCHLAEAFIWSDFQLVHSALWGAIQVSATCPRTLRRGLGYERAADLWLEDDHSTPQPQSAKAFWLCLFSLYNCLYLYLDTSIWWEGELWIISQFYYNEHDLILQNYGEIQQFTIHGDSGEK